jgi:uncharacterized membrane protein YsdA (DUF1294 family)
MTTDLITTLIAINALTFTAFGWDKFCAQKNRRRVPEQILLLLALAGGSPGAFTGRALFGHKTRKQPFVTRLYGVVVLQVSATAFWLFLKYGPRLQA